MGAKIEKIVMVFHMASRLKLIKMPKTYYIFWKITLFLNGSILNGREPWLVDDFSSVISSPKFDFWPKISLKYLRSNYFVFTENFIF